MTGVLRPTGRQDDELLIAELGAVQRVLDRPGEVSLVEVAALYAGAPVDRIAGEIAHALPAISTTAISSQRVFAILILQTSAIPTRRPRSL